MIRRLGVSVRERFDAVDVGSIAVLIAVLVLLGVESRSIALIVVLVLGFPVVHAALEAELGRTVVGILSAVFITGAGLALALSAGGWFAWLLVAAGCWLGLDSIDEWRRRDSAGTADTVTHTTDTVHTAHTAGTDTRTTEDAVDDDLSADEYYLVSAYSWQVFEELRDAERPLTKAELQSGTGIGDEDMDRVLEMHVDGGVIERVGNGYVVDESELGVGAMVRYVVRSVGGRLLRPFGLFRPAG